MPTVMRGDTESTSPRLWTTVLGKLLAAAIIVTPLAAMLFPGLNHCSGNTPSKSRQPASATRSSVTGPSLSSFSVRRSDP